MAESARVTFTQDGAYQHTLVIVDPMWRDSGIYSCIAYNEAGQSVTSCTVTVEADGDYNDAQLPRKRICVEKANIRQLYEIAENEEK